jgi:hypothetical protein
MAVAVLESSSSDGRSSSSSLPVFFFNFGFQQLNDNPWAVKKSTVPTGARKIALPFFIIV